MAVKIGEQSLIIKVPEPHLSVGWLLSQAVREYEKRTGHEYEDEVGGIRTEVRSGRRALGAWPPCAKCMHHTSTDTSAPVSG